MFFFTAAWKSIDPIFENICEDEAKAIATRITNDESTKALENYKYDDLFTVEKDESRKYTNDKCKYITLDNLIKISYILNKKLLFF